MPTPTLEKQTKTGPSTWSKDPRLLISHHATHSTGIDAVRFITATDFESQLLSTFLPSRILRRGFVRPPFSFRIFESIRGFTYFTMQLLIRVCA